jgi:predicted nucleotidyltransferase
MIVTDDIQAVIQKVIAKHVDTDSAFVFLFGSRASGHSRPASDYDVGIYTGQKIPLSVLAKIDDELEDYPIPVDIEVVDFSKVSEEFKRIALQEIEIWNTPKKNLKLI